MRIAIFLDTDHLSGPARLARDFAVDARRLGHQIVMVGLVRGAPAHDNAFTRAMADADLPTEILRERFRFDPAIVPQFLRLLDRFQPDLYQSHGYKGSFLGCRARRGALRWQAVFHGFTWENWRVRLYHALDARWLRRADEVVVVSRPFGRELARRGVQTDRIRWVPNAIAPLPSVPRDARLRRDLGAAAPADFLVGCIGRLSPEKGPDIFIRALALAAAGRPHLRAVLVGDGPLRDACRRLIAESNLADRVRLAGFTDNPAAIYPQLDLLVIPSRSEGLPTVLLEAMQTGVPVVSTRVGGVPDLVRDGETALLAPLNDPPALAAAIGRAADDPALREHLARQAGRLALERLSVAARARTLLDHAAALVAGRPLPPEEPLP